MTTQHPADTHSITVRVTLFADLRRYLPRGHEGRTICALADGATVADLLIALGIPGEDEITVGNNGDLATRATLLHDGDDLVLFSPMEGG